MERVPLEKVTETGREKLIMELHEMKQLAR